MTRTVESAKALMASLVDRLTPALRKSRAALYGAARIPGRAPVTSAAPRAGAMGAKPTPTPTKLDEIFLGYRIRKLEGVYIAVPLQWAGTHGETIAASDLQTLRKEIRRWWYQVGT